MILKYFERECHLERIKLLQRLQKYPTLKALLGEAWFLKRLLEREKNPHLLVELLLEEGPEAEQVTKLVNQLKDSLKTGKIKESLAIDNKLGRLLYFSQFLKYLERYLHRLKEVRGFSGIIDKLRELDGPEEFMFVVNIIELAFSLFEHFDDMEIETEPEPSEIIVKAKHKDRIIHFIFCPPETVERISERISSITKNSVIIPIVHMQHVRKMKDLYDSKELSGFIIYDRMIHYGRPILMGFYIENPEAKNEPIDKEIELLCSQLHLIRFPTTKLAQVFSKKSVQEKLKKGGFYTIQSFLHERIFKHLADWMKTPDDANLLLLLVFSLLRTKSDKYEYRCLALSSLLHLSALTANAQNWWRELTRLKKSFAFLQDGIAQIQNLETILSSKRKASEEIKTCMHA